MPISRPKISPFTALIAGAIVLGILVAWLVVHTLHDREAAAAAALRARLNQDQVTVVVPVRNLKAGAIANSSDMAARSVPQDVVYPDTITADKWPDYVGRVLTHAAFKGRPLLGSDFGPVISSSFADNIPPGTRAFTITVSGVNSIAHLLEPGNQIDLLLLAQGPQGEELLPLLRRIRVLAVGPRSVPTIQGNVQEGQVQAPHYSSITLALTPAQVSRLALAEQVGTLRIALVPQHEPQSGPIPHMLKSDLFPVVATSGPPLPTIQYILGKPGRNSVRDIPVMQPLSNESVQSSAPATSAGGSEQQAMAVLLQQLELRAAANKLSPAPALPKGYP